MSVDGTDCPTANVHDGSRKPVKRHYTIKFKRAGLRYEVGLCIRAEIIVWVAGPYLPGEMNDWQIFQDGMMNALEEGERVEADKGYIGGCPEYCKIPGHITSSEGNEVMRGRVRMRHEAINDRIKVFDCLKKRFDHSIQHHSACFRASVVLTQLGLNSGDEFMNCREYDDRLTDEQAESLFGV